MSIFAIHPTKKPLIVINSQTGQTVEETREYLLSQGYTSITIVTLD